ncbi:MAG: glycosyltransferase family 2 protein [Candidatus Acidiferrales bacterium]
MIIPTRNRAEDLAKTIQSLMSQTVQPTEVVIVDQSVEKSYTDSLPIPTIYIHEQTLSGASHARNVAMDVAQGDIVLFLDDDVVMEPHFIEHILAAYDDGVTGVSGIVTNYQKPPLPRYLWEVVFLRGPFHDDRQPVYWNAARNATSSPIRVRQFTGCLISFRKLEVQAHRFDTQLTGACPGEDIDFCLGLPKDSVLLINPRARLVHKRSPEGRDSIHWLALHAQVYNYLRQRHWRRGLWNNLCFAWLNAGYAIVAVLASMKRASLEPWRAWREGARKGVAIARDGAS